MKEEAVKLHEYYVYVNELVDFKLVLDKVNSAGLNSKNWISIADYPKIGFLFMDESDNSLDGCKFLEGATQKVGTTTRLGLLPQKYIEMIDTYNSQKKEKMENLTIEQVFVHVPFVAITEVLLEAAEKNGLKVSQYIKGQQYLNCKNGKIKGYYDSSSCAGQTSHEVGVNEFMQMILDQNKSVTVKLNGNVDAFISNKGMKIEFSYDKQKRELVSDKMLDELMLFLQRKDKPKFQAGEYCVFPSGDIRRAFAKEVTLSDVRCAEIIDAASSETVMFYASCNAIWLKKDEEAYKAYEPNAIKISMDEFSDRIQFKPKLQLFNHPVSKLSEKVIKFGCQEIPREKLDELYFTIAEQRGEATTMAS